MEKNVLTNEKDIRNYIFDELKMKTGSSIDLSGFNTGKVTDMSGMFQCCLDLTSVDLSGFNTSNVRDMNRMFQGCISLTSIDLSGFNTGKVRNMRFMFDGCESLTSLDISNFNTGNVTDMSGMFCDCPDLTSLRLGKFDITGVTETEDMFKYINPNVEIYLSADSPSVGKIQEQLIKDGVFGAKVHVGDKTYSYEASSKKWNAC